MESRCKEGDEWRFFAVTSNCSGRQGGRKAQEERRNFMIFSCNYVPEPVTGAVSEHSVSPLSVNRASGCWRARNSKLTLKRHVKSVDFVKACRAFPAAFVPVIEY